MTVELSRSRWPRRSVSRSSGGEVRTRASSGRRLLVFGGKNGQRLRLVEPSLPEGKLSFDNANVGAVLFCGLIHPRREATLPDDRRSSEHANTSSDIRRSSPMRLIMRCASSHSRFRMSSRADRATIRANREGLSSESFRTKNSCSSGWISMCVWSALVRKPLSIPIWTILLALAGDSS